MQLVPPNFPIFLYISVMWSVHRTAITHLYYYYGSSTRNHNDTYSDNAIWCQQCPFLTFLICMVYAAHRALVFCLFIISSIHFETLKFSYTFILFLFCFGLIRSDLLLWFLVAKILNLERIIVSNYYYHFHSSFHFRYKDNILKEFVCF